MINKKCIACKNNIKYNAIKCMHCGTVQDNLKYKNEIAYIVLLLTLIISSITFYSQLNKIIDLKEKKNSKIEFDIIGSYDTNIKILIRNEGNVPAVITKGMLTNYLKNGPLTSCKIPFKSPLLVKPNEYIIHTLFPYCGMPRSIRKKNKFYLSDLEKAPKNALCKISLDVMQQGNIETYKSIEFKCVLNKSMSELFDMMKANKTLERNSLP